VRNELSLLPSMSLHFGMSARCSRRFPSRFEIIGPSLTAAAARAAGDKAFRSVIAMVFSSRLLRSWLVPKSAGLQSPAPQQKLVMTPACSYDDLVRLCFLSTCTCEYLLRC